MLDGEAVRVRPTAACVNHRPVLRFAKKS